jgi:hypothetical protein
MLVSQKLMKLELAQGSFKSFLRKKKILKSPIVTINKMI